MHNGSIAQFDHGTTKKKIHLICAVYSVQCTERIIKSCTECRLWISEYVHFHFFFFFRMMSHSSVHALLIKINRKMSGPNDKSNNARLIEIELLRFFSNPRNVVNVEKRLTETQEAEDKKKVFDNKREKNLSIGDSTYHHRHGIGICVCCVYVCLMDRPIYCLRKISSLSFFSYNF